MPTRLRDSSDVDFPSLKATKNNHVIRYNSSIDSFDLVSIDSITGVASGDGDFPDNFVDILEKEVDPNNMTFSSIDGGSF
jgi:hypothetical protein